MSSDNSDNKVIPFANGLRDSANDAVCPICFGTGTRLEPGKGATICDCRRSNSGTRALDAARLPLRFRECSFHNYYPKNDSQYFAHSFASRLVAEYPAVETGLLFMGSVGVGKTHLAVAVLKDLIEKKGVTCLFYESGSLLKAIQDSYNPVSQTSEMRVLAPVYQAEVLVLDELGASVPTNWVSDTLYQIINTRYNNKKLTIFTTNFMDELPERQRVDLGRPYNEASVDSQVNKKGGKGRNPRDEYTLVERIGTPLRSRLHEMCNRVVIEGKDYRKYIEKRRFDSTTA